MRHFIIVTTTLIVTLSLFAQFALTSSAPAHSDALSPHVRQLLLEAKGRSGRGQTAVTGFYQPAVNKAETLRPTMASITNIEANEVAVSESDLSTMARFEAETPLIPAAIPAAAMFRQQTNFCDPGFVGGALTFSKFFSSSLDDLLNQIHARFGVNFVTGPGVGDMPINVKTDNVPWTTILRSQLAVLGIQATCVDGNTVQLIKNNDITSLEQDLRNASALQTRYIKLKYIQPSSSSNKNVAGQSSSGSGGGSSGGGGGQSGGC